MGQRELERYVVHAVRCAEHAPGNTQLMQYADAACDAGKVEGGGLFGHADFGQLHHSARLLSRRVGACHSEQHFGMVYSADSGRSAGGGGSG